MYQWQARCWFCRNYDLLKTIVFYRYINKGIAQMQKLFCQMFWGGRLYS